MFRLFFGGRNETLKTKNHAPGSKRANLSQMSLNTLGSGNIIGAIKLPPGEDVNEWITANTIDFFNEIRLIWDIITEVGIPDTAPGEGFPPGFEYRWATGKTAAVVSGPQYVEKATEWIESELNNEELFPNNNQFPRNFIQSVRVIYTRIFRIFAIIYTNHFNKLEQADAQSHLNTSFKHFLFFCWEYDLVAATELNALKDIVKELKIKYDKSCEAYNKSARK